MHELHGVIFGGDQFAGPLLKRQAILFDKLLAAYEPINPKDEEISATIDFLHSRGLVAKAQWERYPTGVRFIDWDEPRAGELWMPYARDAIVRFYAAGTPANPSIDVIPICQKPLPDHLVQKHPDAVTKMETTLQVAVDAFPIPDDHHSWQDILDFKAGLHDKQWGFRRFLNTLATKNQTEAEIRDEIEWMVNEYRKAMEIHHIKASHSFVDVFVISPMEIIEHLVKFEWSKIAKGIVQVNKRKVELLEAEMRAPGRECAYVFDARKRFGG
jgi:hypothetical protein